MKLSGKDTYRVDCSNFLSEEGLSSLYSLYQPVVGITAIALYMTLYSEGRLQQSQETHNRLSTILNLGVDEIEAARVKLEQALLLRTFVKETSTKNSYVYVLQLPMRPIEYLGAQEFVSELIHVLGKKETEFTAAKVTYGQISVRDCKEVTRPIAHSTPKREYQVEVPLETVAPRLSFSMEDASINFDYNHFLATTSALVFPPELRTQEAMCLIGQLATVYGLDADRMRILVSHCVNLTQNTLDLEKLKVLAMKSKPEVTTSSDPYSLPPVSFLMARQNGAPVSLSDKKILENLTLNYHFSVEVVNTLIDYVLEVSNNRLIKNFVEKVAGEWARDGVSNREEAIAEAGKKKTSVKGSTRTAVLPEYMEATKSKPVEVTMSEEEKNELEELMRKMGKGK